MASDSARPETTNADVLLWQTGYRVALALLAAAIAVGLRTAGILSLSPVADAAIGRDAADWALGIVSVTYVGLVLAINRRVRATRNAGRTLSTLMVVADLVVVFWLVFLLASPEHYDRALLISLFSLQLTHVYFGRGPALLMVVAIAVSYLLVNDIAMRHGATVPWGSVALTLWLFVVGALLVTVVQSNLHARLATLVTIFERAEDGDFSSDYDVAGDRRPDAITVVGRAYNRMRIQLSAIVMTDPLSGCLNRRGFEQQYRRELARAARAQTDIALVAIDLDHFKAVNDTYGHLVGDQVIAETGELLRANARVGDVVARTGGEEFMILAPSTSSSGAQHLALRIVESFRRKEFADPRARVTVSVGIVSDAVVSESIAEDLRARADEALYAAKRSGRNRVVLWSHGLDALKLRDSGSART
ncbi:MAG TPA: GGDEF domain-containing protein [Gemmatimonas sp.]|nr:GGDEF domain-containing protein [Gemmatimonas sp.]